MPLSGRSLCAYAAARSTDGVRNRVVVPRRG